MLYEAREKRGLYPASELLWSSEHDPSRRAYGSGMNMEVRKEVAGGIGWVVRNE